MLNTVCPLNMGSTEYRFHCIWEVFSIPIVLYLKGLYLKPDIFKLTLIGQVWSQLDNNNIITPTESI